ncbi:MAG: DUF4139 domain-containing protein [Phycisphaeraceae bacterium]|nr:MAG: DUF4139 domain-containing protein [Phycisphaeraceae bacterium]
MHRNTMITLAAGALAACSLTTLADSTALTIYSTAQPGGIPAEWYRPVPGQSINLYGSIPGYAVVKQERPFAFDKGVGELSFTGVAALLDPTTVHFESLDNDQTKVLEQDYRFDLVSQQKLIERFIDQDIKVVSTSGSEQMQIAGKLLSASGGLVLQKDNGGIVTINDYDTIDFPSLPGGLLTRPTLVWKTWSPTAGSQDVRLSYQTTGITWWADYNLVFAPGRDENSGTLDVGAWVSILNQSGGTYDDAKLKLIAGEVNRAPQPQKMMRRGGAGGAVEMLAAAPAGFEEKSFFEYHLYTLGRPSTIPDNSTKQIELFEPARSVPAEKVLVYYGLDGSRYGFFANPMVDRNFGQTGNTKVDVYLKFKNEKKAGLGIPMPKGRVRVSQLDPADNSLEFIGEDVIDHTPKDETVLIKLGEAFDVVGQRTQTDFTVDQRAHVMTETIEITLKNHKDGAVKVIAKENLYRWTNWEITKSSSNYEKQDSRTVLFPVTVAKDGEATITYTVKYTW